MKALTLAILLASTSVQAINWDSLEVSKTTVTTDGFDDFEGMGFGGSKLFGNILVTGKSQTLDVDVLIQGINVNFEVESLSIGLGGVVHLSPTTDLFGTYNYHDVETSISFLNYDITDEQSGNGATVGIRSMVLPNVELSASVEYFDVLAVSKSTHIGAQYYLNKDISFGIGYEKDSGESATSIIVRMYY